MVTQNSSNQPYQATKGDLMVGTGSGGRPAILGIGPDNTVPIADSAQTTGIRWGSNTPSGSVVQQIFSSSNTSTPINTSAILSPNTPSISAGTQIVSATITPQNASNFLWIQFATTITGTESGPTSDSCTCALFQDSTSPGFYAVEADPIAGETGLGGTMNMSGNMRIVSGTTSPTTIHLRVGSKEIGSGLTANSGGGAAFTTLTITEIAA